MPDRFSRVDNNLLRGGRPSDADLNMLKNIDVQRIVSLDGNIGKKIAPKVSELGLEHIINPLEDGHAPSVNSIPSLVHQLSDGKKTYVHCFHGKDRTSMVCAMYRVFINGWQPDAAIQDAYRFGMGRGLSNGQSFYDAFHRFVMGDSNGADDIVSVQRDKREEFQPKPGYNLFNPVSSEFGNDGGPLGMQQSFAPFSDAEVDHLNRPASRIDRLKKFAQFVNAGYIFKYTHPSGIRGMHQEWFGNQAFARRACDVPDARMYMARISNNARVQQFAQDMSKTLVQVAMLNGVDVVVFAGKNAPKRYFVINPNALIDIKEVGSDTNNVPLVGQHDNYTGVANLVMPGSGGFMGPSEGGTVVPGSGGGGFAGVVNLPYNSSYTSGL